MKPVIASTVNARDTLGETVGASIIDALLAAQATIVSQLALNEGLSRTISEDHVLQIPANLTQLAYHTCRKTKELWQAWEHLVRAKS